MASSAVPTVRLKLARRSSHPWIFERMVHKPKERIAPGSVVNVVDKENQWVGRGFYNGHSRIALRILTADKEEQIDDAFWERRLTKAISLRRDLLKLDDVSDAYRLVHSEGDGLSGLVVDRFGSLIVTELFSAGCARFRETIQDVLLQHFPDADLFWFAEDHVQKQESFDCRSPQPPEQQIIREHGLRFRVMAGEGHKTGFFVDQRENRKLLASFCEGKRVLDICCNTGGFAVYAKAMGKAEEVIGLDVDEKVIEIAKQNGNLNQAKIRWIQTDLFPWLRDAIPNGQRFDVVVLDPSKQTRDRREVETALRRYTDMNRLAIQTVKPGGIFLTCSCTGLVGEEDFLKSLKRAAWQAARELRVIRITGAGSDHPYLVHVPESRYLKAIFCQVI